MQQTNDNALYECCVPRTNSVILYMITGFIECYGCEKTNQPIAKKQKVFRPLSTSLNLTWSQYVYHSQTSNIGCTLVGYKIVDHSDVVGASPRGAATTARRDQNHSSFGIWCVFYYIFYSKSFWPSDAIWWQRSGSKLALVMAFCLMAPSHYQNQCWLDIKGSI